MIEYRVTDKAGRFAVDQGALAASAANKAGRFEVIDGAKTYKAARFATSQIKAKTKTYLIILITLGLGFFLYKKLKR